MTIKLSPEDEALVRRLMSGRYSTPEEVVHSALEGLAADEDWLIENKVAIQEQIERGWAQLENGDALNAEEAEALLDRKIAEWRDMRRRA